MVCHPRARTHARVHYAFLCFLSAAGTMKEGKVKPNDVARRRRVSVCAEENRCAACALRCSCVGSVAATSAVEFDEKKEETLSNGTTATPAVSDCASDVARPSTAA